MVSLLTDLLTQMHLLRVVLTLLMLAGYPLLSIAADSTEAPAHAALRGSSTAAAPG